MMPVLFRKGCEACHADSAPILDAYHGEMHRLLDIADAMPDARQLRERIKELEDDVEEARDSAHNHEDRVAELEGDTGVKYAVRDRVYRRTPVTRAAAIRLDNAAARLRGCASGIESAAEDVWAKVYRAERAAKQESASAAMR